MSQSTRPTRRTHRKRQSLVRLSSDTTATLPVYSNPFWQQPQTSEVDSDKPPDYSESADEADEDSDTDLWVRPLSPPQASPRRTRRYLGVPSRRRQTGSTSDLDALLQRSVHALEMSNALMQSSMSTQSSLSALLAADNVIDLSLERSALRITSRLERGGNRHENWMDHLDEITRGVNGLFGEDATVSARLSVSSAESLVSCSLPTSSMAHRRRLSLNPRSKAATTDSAPHLHLSSQLDREGLISPAPRAMTLHVVSTDDPQAIHLPSTLGLRSSASAHNSDWRPAEPRHPNMPYSGFHTSASASLPVLTDRPMEPSTPAYNLLSSFVTQQPTCAPLNTPPKPSGFSFRRRRGSSSPASTSTERGLSRRGSGSRSQSITPTAQSPPPAPAIRPMTPPIEELSASSSSSNSSDHPHAYRTVQSLRKILDEQPAPVVEDKKSSIVPAQIKHPVFLPRSPMPVASSGTSTATASISRLLTKSHHHSSTRAADAPTHSSLKRHSAPSTPSTPLIKPSSSASSFPEFLEAGVARIMGSTPSSGRSTPKRISFATLPESYASTRPKGSSRFRDPRERSRKGKGKAKSQVDQVREREENVLGGWWAGWLFAAGAAETGYSSGAQRHEERVEDRVARSWGGRSGFGGIDDWAV